MAEDSSCDTPLHIAARCGDVEEVKRLLNSKQYEVDVQNSDQQTPLHLACANGHVDVVDNLVSEFGASVEVVDSNNYTPLLLGAKNNQTHIVAFLAMMLLKAESMCVVERCHAQMLENLIRQFYHDQSELQEKRWRLFFSKLGLPFTTEEKNSIVVFLVGLFGLKDLTSMVEKDIRLMTFDSSILHYTCMGGYLKRQSEGRYGFYGGSAKFRILLNSKQR